MRKLDLFSLSPSSFVILENETKVEMRFIYSHGLFTRLKFMKMSSSWPFLTYKNLQSHINQMCHDIFSYCSIFQMIESKTKISSANSKWLYSSSVTQIPVIPILDFWSRFLVCYREKFGIFFLSRVSHIGGEILNGCPQTVYAWSRCCSLLTAWGWLTEKTLAMCFLAFHYNWYCQPDHSEHTLSSTWETYLCLKKIFPVGV